MVLPCYGCDKYNVSTGVCGKYKEYMPNGFAMLYYSQKCGRFNLTVTNLQMEERGGR